MKQMKIILLLVFIISAVNSAFSQKEVCACASYSSLQYEINYENIFPHDTIRKEKITQVIIYTTGNSSENPSTPLFTKYIESKFHFDKNGYVSCRIQYRAGRPNEIYEFERNEAGQVTKQTFTYLDSLGQKYPGFPPQITDYSYDNNNNLVLEKQRDVKGQIVDEKKATYTSYEYEKTGKRVKMTNQMYFDYLPSNTSLRITSYNYSNNFMLCIGTTSDNSIKAGVITDSTIYNESGKILSEKMYSPGLKTAVFDKQYTYNQTGKLMTFKTTTGLGGYSECPDKGTYTDHYFYLKNGLVGKIINSYSGYSCEIQFEYLE